MWDLRLLELVSFSIKDAIEASYYIFQIIWSFFVLIISFKYRENKNISEQRRVDLSQGIYQYDKSNIFIIIL